MSVAVAVVNGPEGELLVPEFSGRWVASLLLPLLRHHPEVALVKAAYDRPLHVDGVAHPGSGGRVTRLVATPSLGVSCTGAHADRPTPGR